MGLLKICRNILCAAMLFLLPAIPAQVFCGQELVYEVKNQPARGQPLIVEISAKTGVAYFSVEWQEKTIKAPATCNEANCTASLILPTIYKKSGQFTILISIDKFAPGYTGGKKSFESGTVDVLDKTYDKQSLTVDPKYVKLSQENLDRVDEERKLISKALETFSSTKQWRLPLHRPHPGVISGEFGVQRIFNNEPRNKHTGVDFAGKTGDRVFAVTDGTVILTGEHYFAGNSVYIDHGQGVVSMYFHLSEILLKNGDNVKAGDTVGLVGATGRVTGPHLHFGFSAQGVSVDPVNLF
ncbi:MAG: M23 family metallopeptidase [Deferribacteraceae bacterium]|jgi:murein DD-endopeptidase MepM/ murein hydrolase activator NlpD|nr:M23 family metallopeptidase [Deferribacteraceae bacterium]